VIKTLKQIDTKDILKVYSKRKSGRGGGLKETLFFEGEERA
jgi:hypothetical protein